MDRLKYDMQKIHNTGNKKLFNFCLRAVKYKFNCIL